MRLQLGSVHQASFCYHQPESNRNVRARAWSKNIVSAIGCSYSIWFYLNLLMRIRLNGRIEKTTNNSLYRFSIIYWWWWWLLLLLDGYIKIICKLTSKEHMQGANLMTRDALRLLNRSILLDPSVCPFSLVTYGICSVFFASNRQFVDKNY